MHTSANSSNGACSPWSSNNEGSIPASSNIWLSLTADAAAIFKTKTGVVSEFLTTPFKAKWRQSSPDFQRKGTRQ